MAKTYKCFEVKENGNWRPAPLSEVRGIAAIGKIQRARKVKGVGSSKRRRIKGIGSKKKKGWF